MIRVHRYPHNPILARRIGVDWEVGGVFNPAVARYHDKYMMIYRAYGQDKISRLGLAVSTDGVHFTRPDTTPILIPFADDPETLWGVEDPRITALGDTFYLTFTAVTKSQHGTGQEYQARVRIAATRDFKTFIMIDPDLSDEFDKDAVLFPERIDGKFVMLHRLVPNIQLTTSADMLTWSPDRLLATPTSAWETDRIGSGPPPIRTPHGWLLFYHGVSREKHYSMGAMLLDLKQPWRVIGRTLNPLLSPQAKYETCCVVPNVVFGTGLVEKPTEYWLYYGGADDNVSLAMINKSDLLGYLCHEGKIDQSAPERLLPR